MDNFIKSYDELPQIAKIIGLKQRINDNARVPFILLEVFFFAC